MTEPVTAQVAARPFAAAVAWLGRYVPTRPAWPILGGTVLHLGGGHVRMTAYDDQVAAHTSVSAHETGAARIVVSGRLLAALVDTLPDKPITLRVDDAALALRCGSVAVTLPLMPAEDYPLVPGLPPVWGHVDGSAFAALVDRVAVAADRSGKTAVAGLQGVHLSCAGQAIEALACDRYRAGIGSVSWEPSGDGPAVWSAIVPAAALQAIGRTFDGAGAVAVSGRAEGERAGLLGFAGAGRSVVSATIAEDYPTHLRTLFPARADTPAVVETAELVAALKRASLVRAQGSPAVLTLDVNALRVGAQGSGGVAADIECDYPGPPITLNINPDYLLEGLAALRCPAAEITATAQFKPILLTPYDEADAHGYRHIVVPIRATT